MLGLSLRPTIIGDRPIPNDFSVVRTSESFGARRVGRIRLAGEYDDSERREWAINPPVPVPAWGPRPGAIARVGDRRLSSGL
jgi:hypothetical protein